MKFKRALCMIASSALLAGLAVAARADTNILQGNWQVLATSGVMGTLRSGSVWTGDGGTLASLSSIVDGAFLPEQTQWDYGTWWWDQDPSVNASPVVTTIQLNGFFTIDRLLVQADNNDTYGIRYRDNGGIWQDLWTVGSVAGYGMMTRDSGIIGSIVTDALEFTALGGDNYYAVSEIQAFSPSVPEPATLSLIAAALAVVGFTARRKQG